MARGMNGGGMVPDYGSDAPVVPVEKGNIDITSKGYARYLKSAYGSMMIVPSQKMYALIPKVDPIGSPMEEDIAYKLYKKTGGHLGQFSSEEEATIYAKWLRGRAKEVATYLTDDVSISSSGNPMLMDVEGIDAEAKMARNAIRMKIAKTRGLSAKGLGQSIRRAAEPFDPNAIDGDNDGIVQDGTQWARPSLPGAPVIASMRSLGSGQSFVPENTQRAAKAMADVYKANEPRVTERMREIEKLAEGKAKLVDLDSRLKGVDSLASKIERLKGAWDNDVTAAASQMNDGLRYTFVANKDSDYTDFVKAVASMLRSEGQRVTSWNYWNATDPYQGINMMVQDRAGFNYEIQFHTKASHSVKKKLEPLYQKFRDETNPSKRKEIYDRMRAQTPAAPKPAGVSTIGEHIERGRTASSFTPAITSDIVANRLSTSSLRSASRGTSATDIPEGDKKEELAIGKTTLTGDMYGKGPLSTLSLFAEDSEVPLTPREQQAVADRLVRAWLESALAYIYGPQYYKRVTWEERKKDGKSVTKILEPLNPYYAKRPFGQVKEVSPLANIGPQPEKSLVGLAANNKVTSKDDIEEVKLLAQMVLLERLREFVGAVPNIGGKGTGLDPETGKPGEYDIKGGNWSFLSWVPTLSGTPAADDTEKAETLAKEWGELTKQINPGLKFIGGSSHVWAKTKTGKSEPNDLQNGIERIVGIVSGTYGRDKRKGAGEYERDIEYEMDPATGSRKLDPATGQPIAKNRPKESVSLNQAAGRDRDDEVGDLIDGGVDETEVLATDVGQTVGEVAADVLGAVENRTAYDYGNVPDPNDKAAYDDLLETVAALGDPELGEQLKELHESAPKFARVIIDRILFGEFFKPDESRVPQDKTEDEKDQIRERLFREAIAMRHGLSTTAAVGLFGKGPLSAGRGVKESGVLDIDEDTGKLKLTQLIGDIRNAYPQIVSSLESRGESVNQENIAKAIARQFGVPASLARALVGDIAPEKTGLTRVRDRQAVSTDSVTSLVRNLIQEGKGRQEILNALFFLLKPERDALAKDNANTNKQVAEVLTTLLGRPVKAGSLNSVLSELGLNIEANGKSAFAYSPRADVRFVVRYSAKSLHGFIDADDEVATPPGL